MATQAWLESRGQIAVSTSVLENVALDPGLDAEVRWAAAVLDRHRLEDGLPGPPPSSGEDPVAETAAVVDAGGRVVRFVEERMDADGGSTRSGGDP